MAFVIYWFFQTAKIKRLNKLLWSIVGGLSYFLPVIILRYITIPKIFLEISISKNTNVYILTNVIISVLIGVLSCLIARKILLKKIN